MFRAALLCACALTVASPATLAGDLNPPPGPVAPTMKTLDEVEPSRPINTLPGNASSLHVISESGAYHLTGNIQSPGGGFHAIFSSAEEVTIDLRGFTIDGVGNEIAPAVRLNRTSIVRNGIIENWGTSAVTSVSSHNRVEGIVFDFIDGPVIDCDQRLVVLDCSFRLCEPLDVENHTLIQNCRFYSMSEVISSPAADNVALIDVTIAGQNTTEAGPVIELGNEARLHRVSVANEGRNALSAGNNASVIDCAFTGNGSTAGGDGLQLGTRALVKGCVIAEYGGDGIVTGLAAHIEGNNVSDCDENGIVTTGSSTIIGNTVYSNGDDGIVAGFTSHVRNNTVRSHGGDGILCSTDCFIVGNQLDNDPIHVTGAGNTIDFNSVTSINAGPAIDTDSGGNRISRNTLNGPVDSTAGANIVFQLRNTGNFDSAGPWDNFLVP